jgi:hypothetical protein
MVAAQVWTIAHDLSPSIPSESEVRATALCELCGPRVESMMLPVTVHLLHTPSHSSFDGRIHFQTPPVFNTRSILTSSPAQKVYRGAAARTGPLRSHPCHMTESPARPSAANEPKRGGMATERIDPYVYGMVLLRSHTRITRRPWTLFQALRSSCPQASGSKCPHRHWPQGDRGKWSYGIFVHRGIRAFEGLRFWTPGTVEPRPFVITRTPACWREMQGGACAGYDSGSLKASGMVMSRGPTSCRTLSGPCRSLLPFADFRPDQTLLRRTGPCRSVSLRETSCLNPSHHFEIRSADFHVYGLAQTLHAINPFASLPIIHSRIVPLFCARCPTILLAPY